MLFLEKAPSVRAPSESLLVTILYRLKFDGGEMKVETVRFLEEITKERKQRDSKGKEDRGMTVMELAQKVKNDLFDQLAKYDAAYDEQELLTDYCQLTIYGADNQKHNYDVDLTARHDRGYNLLPEFLNSVQATRGACLSRVS